jgi:hypothetical protein
MPGISFITHKGVKILYEDVSNSKIEDIIPFIGGAKAIISSQPKNSVLALVNVKDANFNITITNTLKDFMKANAPYIKCAAVYGVDGMKEIIFKGILNVTGRKNLILCKTLEEGKDYLANQK